MQLKLQRTQRAGGLMGTTAVFALDARVHLTSAERDSVQRYKLGSQVIYNSQASRRHLDAAQAASSQGTTRGHLKGIASIAMAAMNLNITINSLERGQHIECKDLDELLSAEDELMDACTRLKGYLDTAATFDGREMVFDFNGREPVATVTMLPAEPPRPALSPSSEPPASSQPMMAQPDASMAATMEYEPQSSGSADFDATLQRLKYFWASRTTQQKVAYVLGGLFAFYVLTRIL